MPANLESSAVATGLVKVSFHFKPKERQCQGIFRLPHTCKVMLKILQARLQQYMNGELPDVQAWFRNPEEPEINLPTSVGSLKKQENSRKTSTSTLLTTPKALTVWITTNCGKFLKRWEYQITLPVSWETCMRVKKQQNWTWNNRLDPNQKRSTSRLYIVTLLI